MNLTQEVASLLVYVVIAVTAGWAATLVTAHLTALLSTMLTQTL